MFFPHVYSPRQGQTTYWEQNFDDNRKAFSLCPYVASFKMISSKPDFIHIFNDFIHVYSPGARAYNPLGTNFWCQQKALITLPIRCKFRKRNLILYTFLMILYMYIAPGQGQTTPWGQTFNVNRKPFSLCPFVAGSKKILSKSNFIYIFFMFHHMYIAPGRGRQSIGDKILMSTEKPFLFAHMLQVSKWYLRNLISCTFLTILYMYRAPGQGQKTFWGQTFDVNKKPLSLGTICCKFQTNLFEFWFYTHFLMFFHMYIALGQGQTTLCGQDPDFNRKALSLCPFVASFKKISLKSDFIHNFSCFYTCIWPWGRGRQPLGVRIFI